jgi:precorrin-4/cobalt-precorrin-4 C11-methyltransferase
MIYFVGAGPGDPGLMTLRGRSIIENSPIIIYAGSLINPALLEWASPDAEVYDSAGMDLTEIIAIMSDADSSHKDVARLHTGDPSIYGAIAEQMDCLDKLKISYEIVPGVSSFSAAAAVLKKEYTIPELSQTVILTRAAGRTPVPPEQGISALAAHKASLAIFLSVHMIDEVVEQLRSGYKSDIPVAVVEKATWPDQRIITGRLSDIGPKVRGAGMNRTALILAGPFLEEGQQPYSKLYDSSFTHGYRKGSAV